MAEFWSNNDRGYRIRLWIDQTSQYIAGNSSQVRVRLALLNGAYTFAEYNCSAYVDLNGQRLNWSGRPSVLSTNQTLMLIDQTITVGHNADGTKSFGLMASFSGSGGWSPGTLTIGGNSFTLTTIPRSSSISTGSGVIGSALAITINRQSDSFSHTLRYAWGNKSGTIASNVGASYSWTIPNDFASDIPNATSGTGTLYVDTYSGGTLTGTQQVSFTASLPASIKPTFSGITLTDTNGVARGLLSGNNFLQVISNIQVTFSGANGTYGSTITGYKAELVNKNQVTNSNGGTLGIMNFNGSATIRASVFDSRGRQSDTKDITINVIEYFSPILSFTAFRTRENPNIIQVVRNAKIAPISLAGKQKNVMSLNFKVSQLGSNQFTNDNGSASGTFTTQSALTNSAANLAGNYRADKSFDVICVLSDKFTSVEFKAPTVTSENVIIGYDKDGHVGIGKIPELGKAGSLDVKGDIYANNSQIQQYQLTSSDGAPKWIGIDEKFASKNANLIDQPGQYYLPPDAYGNPNGQLGYLFHYSCYGKNTDDFKEAIQTFWGNNGQLFFRHHRWSRIIDDWEPWIDYTPKKTSVVKLEIQIGWGVRANLVRESNVVTLSLERGIYHLPPGEYINLSEKIPNGFKPCVQTHMVVNRNASNWHYGCAVWHLEKNGDIRLSNPNIDIVDGNAVYTGTVTYITEDEYPNN